MRNQSNSPDNINLLKSAVNQNGTRDFKKSKWSPFLFRSLGFDHMTYMVSGHVSDLNPRLGEGGQILGYETLLVESISAKFPCK